MIGRAGKRACVLFVDDEATLLEAVRLALRREAFDIVTAGSGAEALELLERGGIDVVVSDERMPQMTGAEFLAEVCRRHPHVLRIMLTGQASLEAAVKAINDGEVFRFLIKPCHPVELAQTIHTALQVKELQEQCSRLLWEARRRKRTLTELEQRHPGITTRDRGSDGTYDLDGTEPADFDTLLREIKREVGE